MKSIKLLLVLVTMSVSQGALFAYGDIDLLIIPPDNDGGSKLRYYEIQYTTDDDFFWKDTDKCRVLYPPYRNQEFSVNGLEANHQYIFRVRVLNDYGAGPWGDRVYSPTLHDNEILNNVKVQSGPGKAKVGRSFCLPTPLFETKAPDIKVPFRVE